jgi:hypothetical protein
LGSANEDLSHSINRSQVTTRAKHIHTYDPRLARVSRSCSENEKFWWELLVMKSDPKVILDTAEIDKNVLIKHKQNVPIAREYIRSKEVQELAVEKYRKNGRGITFNDLISRGITKTKGQAQRKLKNCLKNKVLFTIQHHKPQLYYPTCIKSHILENKNAPIDPTGVQYRYNEYHHQHSYTSSSSIIAYIVSLLPSTPSYIHNMHFKLNIPPQCYIQLNLPQYSSKNKGKHQYENISSAHVDYTFYPRGTVDITVKCSSNPLKLEDDTDLARLIAFLGQLRDRLIILLADKRERLVPDITQWYLTELDINKDIVVSDSVHIVPKIQVKHLNDLFRIYIKSMGEHTVCRVEKSMHPPSQKSPIDVINDIFNSVGTQQ